MTQAISTIPDRDAAGGVGAPGSGGAPGADPGYTTLITPHSRGPLADLRELVRHRDLALVLAVRDLQVRYKQTLLGFAWAILQPLAQMVVLHLFFGRLFGMAERVGGVPYPVFLFAGLLGWTLFSGAVTAASQSLVNNAHILGKVYFPRLLLPLAALAAPAVDYGLAMLVLLGMMAWFGVTIGPSLLLLIPLLITLLVTAAGLGVTLAGIMVWFRDVRQAVPFALQLLFFLTPVVMPVSIIPTDLQWLAYLNPLTGTIEAMRAAVLGEPIPWLGWLIAADLSVLGLVLSCALFASLERRFADVI